MIVVQWPLMIGALIPVVVVEADDRLAHLVKKTDA
jgi:hypothetical protein